MRLFGREPDVQEPPDSQVSEPVPEQTYEPVTLTEDQLREADLGTLYNEDGGPLYRWGDGTPCDVDGNIIPETRPDFTAPPATATPTPEPEAARPALTSPFAQGIATTEELEQWSEAVGGTQALGVIEQLAYRMASKLVAADRQQRRATSQLGLAPEVIDEYTDRISQVEHMVPANLRGTKEGAIMAASLAAGLEAWENGGDLGSVYRRLGGVQNQTVAPQSNQPVQRQPLPPSAVTHVPNASPTSVRMAMPRQPQRTVAGLTESQRDVINQHFAGKNGIR